MQMGPREINFYTTAKFVSENMVCNYEKAYYLILKLGY